MIQQYISRIGTLEMLDEQKISSLVLFDAYMARIRQVLLEKLRKPIKFTISVYLRTHTVTVSNSHVGCKLAKYDDKQINYHIYLVCDSHFTKCIQ
jgi:hypothetical protein